MEHRQLGLLLEPPTSTLHTAAWANSDLSLAGNPGIRKLNKRDGSHEHELYDCDASKDQIDISVYIFGKIEI